MENNKKVFVVGNQTDYANFIRNYTLVNDIKEADIVLFTGGEDVDPSLYGHPKHPSTYSNIERDNYEKEIFEQISPSQIAVGICRGSQFLCVMNGGQLIQDVNAHAIWGTHTIQSDTEHPAFFEITSTHHQMQMPYNLPISHYKVLYWAKRAMYHSMGNEEECMPLHLVGQDKEPEIVLYKVPGKPKCLAIQGHPEYMDPNSVAVKTINSIIDSL